MASITVVIPCYNAAKWVCETLDSVLAQNFQEIEIIVVDDGSTDDSAATIQQHYPFVRLIQTENRGASHARNTGTAAATGDFIQYLDADDLLAPNKLHKQTGLLEQTGADVAYGDWQRLVLNAAGQYELGEVVSRQLGNEPELSLFTNFWCPPAVYLFRRSIVEAVGRWNENLPIIQDARFVLDCALHGGRFVYCPEVVASYRVHPENSLSTRDKMAFTRDVFTNGVEVQAWWQAHGGLTPARRQVLLKLLTHVTRDSYRTDAATFDAAYHMLSQLDSRFVPAKPAYLRQMSRIMGYKRALVLDHWYRNLKSRIRPYLPANSRTPNV